MKRSARTLSVLPLVAMVAGLLSGAAAPGGSEPKGDRTANVPAGRAGFVLSTTQPGGKGFAPAFVGNGYLAGRQPADGQGFDRVELPGRTEPLATQSEVQGFYARVTAPDTGRIERRAALPAWSTLRYDDGSGPYTLARGAVRNYRQSLNLRTGTLTTTLRWTSPAGRTTRLRYDVTPDRARKHAALVRLRFAPQFAGTVTVTDLLDGTAAELTDAAGTGRAGRTQWVDLTTKGLKVRATVASVLRGPSRTLRAVAQSNPQSVAQRMRVKVVRGRTYEVTKSVGVAVSTDTGTSGSAHRRAVRAARHEAALGYTAARVASDRAWRRLWVADINVTGAPRLQRQVRASYFWLLASIRSDVPWAPSPGGLSSDGYNGHVFWDSETWMYPAMLATQPSLARAMLQYRVDRLKTARANARQTGFGGARYPWESALSGLEDTPSCCLTGKLEVHVNADIPLAFWQYWLATRDRAWLAKQAWPVVSGIADFWVSRSTRNADGTWSINDVIPPDEYAEHVNDSVYTNLGARDALRIARSVARLVARPAKPAWRQVADHLRIPFDAAQGIHPEYAGYPGNTIKQADVTLLSYPWENNQSSAQTSRDLDYYVPRTDPNGPSMTDAIHSIVTSKLGAAGCAAFSFTKRSADPFMRPPYDQFSEARTGGAFTFTTGAGGFLQEFIYGYTGLRWRSDRVALDPSLPPQLTGVTLSAVHWQGRTLRVAVRRAGTKVTLTAGPAMRVTTRGGTRTLKSGKAITLATRRPDLSPTTNVARCSTAVAQPATAEPPEAAVDGTDTTTWLAEQPGTAVTVDLGRTVALRDVTVSRPPVLAIAPPDPTKKAVTGPVDSAGEDVAVSADGQTWTTLASVTAPALRDVVAGSGQQIRLVRVVSRSDATDQHPLVVGELTVRAT
jgi:trehalose/maltose hydrolase-like predicted phosphorylase